MGHLTLTTHTSFVICRLQLVIVNLPTTFYASISSGYKYMKGDVKWGDFGYSGITQDPQK